MNNTRMIWTLARFGAGDPDEGQLVVHDAGQHARASGVLEDDDGGRALAIELHTGADAASAVGQADRPTGEHRVPDSMVGVLVVDGVGRPVAGVVAAGARRAPPE